MQRGGKVNQETREARRVRRLIEEQEKRELELLDKITDEDMMEAEMRNQKKIIEDSQKEMDEEEKEFWNDEVLTNKDDVAEVLERIAADDERAQDLQTISKTSIDQGDVARDYMVQALLLKRIDLIRELAKTNHEISKYIKFI